jgi:hypothetical protein
VRGRGERRTGDDDGRHDGNVSDLPREADAIKTSIKFAAWSCVWRLVPPSLDLVGETVERRTRQGMTTRSSVWKLLRRAHLAATRAE